MRGVGLKPKRGEHVEFAPPGVEHVFDVESAAGLGDDVGLGDVSGPLGFFVGVDLFGRIDPAPAARFELDRLEFAGVFEVLIPADGGDRAGQHCRGEPLAMQRTAEGAHPPLLEDLP